MTEPFDIAERYELTSSEIDVDVYAEETATCVDCEALLNDDEMLLGAWCSECRPNQGMESVSLRLIRRLRGGCGS